MRLLKRTIIVLVVALLLFIGYTMSSTGFFRTIAPKFNGEIVQKISITGAEDIMVSRKDSFALISATDRANIAQQPEREGGLFLLDLRTDKYTPIPLTNTFTKPFEPHGISFFKKGDGYKVMAINHTNEGHSIEVFQLQGSTLKHTQSLRHSSMIQPNDLVMLDAHRFYFTNDHGYTKGLGKLIEEYTGLALSNVVYFDGENYTEVAKGIAYANGINFDAKRNLLFVASPRKFLVKVFIREADGSLSFVEDIPCGTGVDNIEFDEAGNLWIGSHPNLLRFAAYSQGKKETTPSEIIKISYRAKGDYSIETIYLEDGEEMSGSTVAAVFGDLIFTGNVMDEAFLVLKRNE